MNRKILAHAVWCALLSLSTPISPSFAAEWQPQLLPPQSGELRKAGEAIRIQIPTLSEATVKTLTFEFDDIDITSVIKRSGNTFSYTPTQPLQKGQHVLRVVENAADGSILERGAWTIDVRKSKKLRESATVIDATLTITRRISEDIENNDPLATPVEQPDKTQGTGSFSLTSNIANKDWRLKSRIELVYTSQKELTVRQKSLDLASYLFTHSVGHFETNVGHHTVTAPDSMILHSITRRGISARYYTPETGFNAGVFSVRGAEIVGFTGGLGVSNSDNRISGATITARPLKNNRNALEISSTAISGRGPQVGAGEGGDPTQVQGSAVNVVADGNMLKKRLRIRGEAAATRFDADGSANALKKESDNAYSLLLQFSPWTEKQVKGKPMGLQFGVENKKIGTFFRSITNIDAVSDRNLIRGFLNFNWSGFDLQASLGRERDNVNNLAIIGQSETTQQIINISYAPEQKYKEDGTAITKWYGQPNYSLAYFRSDQEVIDASATLAKGKLLSTRNLEGTAAFIYNTWDWSLTLRKGREEDLSGNNPDSRSEGADLAANFRIGEKLTISPGLQFNTSRDTRTNIDTDTTDSSLNITYNATSKLNTSFTYTLNHVEAPGDGIFAAPVDTETKYYSFLVNYKVVEPKGNKPGLSVSLTGSRNEIENNADPAQSTETTQVILSLTVGWSPTY